MTAGCSLVVPFSCTQEGSAASDRLSDDLEGLSSVPSAEVVSDCDSGGENYVVFETSTFEAGREELGPASVFLVADQAKGTHQAVTLAP